MIDTAIKKEQIDLFNKTEARRKASIKKDGSPYFPWQVPATTAGAITQIEIRREFPAAVKYFPIDFVDIVNSDVVGITILINGAAVLRVPASTTRQIANSYIHQIGIQNDDSAVTSTLNEITLTLQRQPETLDSIARGS